MDKSNRVKIGLITLIVLLVFGADQWSKHIVRQQVESNSHTEVVGKYLILTKVENTGAFLGMGDTLPRPIYKLLMILLPLLLIGYTIYFLVKRGNLSIVMVLAMSFIIAGGLGNIYDRLLYGSVTDFLFFDFVIFHTGIVNIADIFVTAGFFMILFDLYINRKNYSETEKSVQ